jgi:hypothetical protein
VVKQHNADGANDLAHIVAQRDAADHKGARLVGEQVDEHGLTRLQHTAHTGVGDHLLHRAPHELIHRGDAQVREKTLVALVHPNDATAQIHQKHALADGGEKLKHRPRCQLQNALGIQRQRGYGVGGVWHGPRW